MSLFETHNCDTGTEPTTAIIILLIALRTTNCHDPNFFTDETVMAPNISLARQANVRELFTNFLFPFSN